MLGQGGSEEALGYTISIILSELKDGRSIEHGGSQRAANKIRQLSVCLSFLGFKNANSNAIASGAQLAGHPQILFIVKQTLFEVARVTNYQRRSEKAFKVVYLG